MTRIVRAATMSANTTTTTTTITATIGGFLSLAFPRASAGPSSVHHKRSRSADLDDLDALSCVEHVSFVVAASGPHLAVDLHAADALSVGDSLEHDCRSPDQRGSPCADRRRKPAVTAGDRP